MDKKSATLSKKELEGITDGLSVEDLVSSIDHTMDFLLFNAHKLDMRIMEGHTYALHVTKKVLSEIKIRE